MRIFSRVPSIDFMRTRKPMLALSALLLIVSVVALAQRGMNFGIDFSGGVLVEVGYPQPVVLDELRDTLDNGGFQGATVQYFGTRSDVLIRLAPDDSESSDELSDRIFGVLEAQNPDVELRRVEFVGPQVGEELAVDGGLAAMFALILILIYIAFRFEWKFAIGAVAATAHDAVLVLGFFSLLQIEFDLSALAAVLAVIGYSLNDTIVVFDRVRENFLGSRSGGPLEIINGAVNQTLARTVVTGVTTLIVLICLFLYGGEILRGFSDALIVGIIVGTYSSIFVASAVVVQLGITREDLLPPTQEELDEMP